MILQFCLVSFADCIELREKLMRLQNPFPMRLNPAISQHTKNDDHYKDQQNGTPKQDRLGHLISSTLRETAKSRCDEQREWRPSAHGGCGRESEHVPPLQVMSEIVQTAEFATVRTNLTRK